MKICVDQDSFEPFCSIKTKKSCQKNCINHVLASRGHAVAQYCARKQASKSFILWMRFDVHFIVLLVFPQAYFAIHLHSMDQLCES